MSSPIPSKNDIFSEEYLQKMRYETDPLADETAEKIIGGGQTEEVNRFFRLLADNDELPTEKMPDVVQEYLLKTTALPDYADPTLIKEGEAFFALYGPEIAMMLLTKSLPASYGCKKGAEVLHSTGRLDKNRDGGLSRFTRRLMETSQFVINVMQAGGLGEDGYGIRAAQKVRLMHASIRYFLRNHQWDSAAYDEPINQEDMAGTLMDFAVYPIEGLEQLGFEVTERQKKAFYHCWRVVGHTMGVRPELIPDNYADGSRLGHAILEHQKAPSEAGRELTEALLEFLRRITPGTLFDFYPEMLVRFLMGDELADMLGVPAHDDKIHTIMGKTALKILDKGEEIKDHSELVKRLARHFSGRMLQGMVNYFNNEKQVQFFIPPSLRENWEQRDITSAGWDDVYGSPALGNWRMSIQRKKTK